MTIKRPTFPTIVVAYFLCIMSCIAGMTPAEIKEFEAIKRDAETGNAEAQFNLAGCYFTGRGTEKDLGTSVVWLRKAANQGLSAAQNNLGLCYFNGTGVTRDYAESVIWFR